MGLNTQLYPLPLNSSRPLESLQGYMGRVGLANHYGKALWYRDVLPPPYLPLNALRSAEHYSILSRLTGLEVSLLRDMTLHRFVPSFYSAQELAGLGEREEVGDLDKTLWECSLLQLYTRNSASEQLCPRCWEEWPTLLLPWSLRHVTTCPFHKVLLVDRCSECQAPLRFDPATSECGRCGAHVSMFPTLSISDHEPSLLLTNLLWQCLGLSEWVSGDGGYIPISQHAPPIMSAAHPLALVPPATLLAFLWRFARLLAARDPQHPLFCLASPLSDTAPARTAAALPVGATPAHMVAARHARANAQVDASVGASVRGSVGAETAGEIAAAMRAVALAPKSASVLQLHRALVAVSQILADWPHSWQLTLRRQVAADKAQSQRPFPGLLMSQFAGAEWRWLHAGLQEFIEEEAPREPSVGAAWLIYYRSVCLQTGVQPRLMTNSEAAARLNMRHSKVRDCMIRGLLVGVDVPLNTRQKPGNTDCSANSSTGSTGSKGKRAHKGVACDTGASWGKGDTEAGGICAGGTDRGDCGEGEGEGSKDLTPRMRSSRPRPPSHLVFVTVESVRHYEEWRSSLITTQELVSRTGISRVRITKLVKAGLLRVEVTLGQHGAGPQWLFSEEEWHRLVNKVLEPVPLCPRPLPAASPSPASPEPPTASAMRPSPLRTLTTPSATPRTSARTPRRGVIPDARTATLNLWEATAHLRATGGGFADILEAVSSGRLPAYRDSQKVGEERSKEKAANDNDIEETANEGARERSENGGSLDELWFYESDVWTYKKREQDDSGGRLLVTTDDAGWYLGGHRSTVRILVAAGLLTPVVATSAAASSAPAPPSEGAPTAAIAEGAAAPAAPAAPGEAKGEGKGGLVSPSKVRERFDIAEVIALSEKYLTAAEVADALGWQRRAVYQWLWDGHCPTQCAPLQLAGGRYLFPKLEFSEWKAQLMTAKEASRLLGVTRKVLQQWARRGVLPLASGSGKTPAFYLFERAALTRQSEEGRLASGEVRPLP